MTKLELKKYRLLKSKFEVGLSMEDFLIQVRLEDKIKTSKLFKKRQTQSKDLSVETYVNELLNSTPKTKSQLQEVKSVFKIFDNVTDSLNAEILIPNTTIPSIFAKLPSVQQTQYFDFIAPPSKDKVTAFHIKAAIDSLLSGEDTSYKISNIVGLSPKFFELIKEELNQKYPKKKSVPRSFIRDKIRFFETNPVGQLQSKEILKGTTETLFPSGFVEEFVNQRLLSFDEWLLTLDINTINTLQIVKEVPNLSTTLYKYKDQLISMSLEEELKLSNFLSKNNRSIFVVPKTKLSFLSTGHILGKDSFKYDVLSSLNTPEWYNNPLFKNTYPNSKGFENNSTPNPPTPRTKHQIALDSLISSVESDLSSKILSLELELNTLSSTTPSSKVFDPNKFPEKLETYVILQNQLESFQEDVKSRDVLMKYNRHHEFSSSSIDLLNYQSLKFYNGDKLYKTLTERKRFPLAKLRYKIRHKYKSIFSPSLPTPTIEELLLLQNKGIINMSGKFLKRTKSKTTFKQNVLSSVLTPSFKSKSFFNKKLNLPNWDNKVKLFTKNNSSPKSKNKNLGLLKTIERNSVIWSEIQSNYSRADILDVEEFVKDDKKMNARFAVLKEELSPFIKFDQSITLLELKLKKETWKQKTLSQAKDLGIEDYHNIPIIDLAISISKKDIASTQLPSKPKKKPNKKTQK